jgi:hypothetical protein
MTTENEQIETGLTAQQIAQVTEHETLSSDAAPEEGDALSCPPTGAHDDSLTEEQAALSEIFLTQDGGDDSEPDEEITNATWTK